MFSLGNRTAGKSHVPPDPHWARDAKGRFHRFTDLDPEEEGVKGVSGVFVIWHGGLRPEWLLVAKSGNLAFDFHKLAHDKDLMSFEARGGLFVTWALIKGDLQDGVVRFLSDILDPVLENPEFSSRNVPAIPVVLPTTE